MNYTAIGVSLLIAASVAAAAISLYEDRRRRAELDVDMVRLRDIGARYAALRCGDLPGSDVALSAAAKEVGVSVDDVGHRDRWQLSLSSIPGSMGFALEAVYTAAASSWQITHLLRRHNAVRTSTGAAVALERRKPSPNRSSFQLLLEGESC